MLNWQSRGEDPCALGNMLVGFGAVALNDVWGVTTGEAREIVKVFLVVDLAFAAAFGLLIRAKR